MKKLFLSVIALTLVASVPVLAGGHGQAACCAGMAGVERTVAKLDNGVRITLLAKDQATVTKLQAQGGACPAEHCRCPIHAEGVHRVVERVEGGVVITATASEKALVTSLHTMAAASCPAKSSASKGECCKPKAAHASCQGGATT